MRISDWSSDVCSSDLVADDRFWLAPGAPAAARLRGALGEQLALGEDGEWNAASGLGVECEAVVERGDGHGETRAVIPAFAGMTVFEERPEVRQHHRPQIRGLQHLQQRLEIGRAHV